MILVALAHASTADWHLAQARQFRKRGWWNDVATELHAAEAEGLPDRFAAWWTAAELHYELCEASAALAASNRAAVLSPDDAGREQALNLATLLDQGWGRVAVQPPAQAITVRLKVERVSPQVDPELDRLTRQCAVRWAGGTPLPSTLDLPVGDWTINGQAVEIRGEVPAALTLRRVGSASLQRTTLHVGAGLGLAGSPRAGLLVAPALRALVDAPLGPVDLGVGLAWAPAVWDTPTGATWGRSSAYADLRLGHTFAVGEELAVVPWLGVRGGRQDGVPLACSLEGVCTAPTDEEPEAHVYPTSWVVSPFVAVGVQWTPPHGPVGLGFEVGAGETFGWLPASGEAAWADREGTLTWSTTTTAWQAFGGSVAVDLVFRL